MPAGLGLVPLCKRQSGGTMNAGAAPLHRTHLRAIAVSDAALASLILAPAAGQAAGQAEPAATGSPGTDLVDGQTVTVEITGFPANATIAVVQCTAAPPVSNAECDEERFVLSNAAAAGSGTAEFPVHTSTIGSDGSICDAGDNNDCSIVVTDFPVTV